MITEESRKEALQRWKLLTDKMVAELQAAGSDITVGGREKADSGQTPPSSGMMTFAINMTPPMGAIPEGKRPRK